jgi:hypothetical protein
MSIIHIMDGDTINWSGGSGTFSIAIEQTPAIAPVVGPGYGITPYSQNDPRWKHEVYAGGTTFGTAGCYVTCVAMIASLTGSLDTPPIIADALFRANCFVGNLLIWPENIPQACPGLTYHGTEMWHDRPADLDAVWAELRLGPTILEVDFRPTTREFNQHFVIGLWHDEGTDDIAIIDPWDGARVGLLERYELVWYALGTDDLKSAICGMRLLRIKK